EVVVDVGDRLEEYEALLVAASEHDELLAARLKDELRLSALHVVFVEVEVLLVPAARQIEEGLSVVGPLEKFGARGLWIGGVQILGRFALRIREEQVRELGTVFVGGVHELIRSRGEVLREDEAVHVRDLLRRPARDRRDPDIEAAAL